MTLQNTFMLLGGLGLLLFGMKMMSSGLEKVAGDAMQSFLRRATGNRFLAVLVGIVATIAVNSSTASTIMTVSFVNSGMLTLFQSIGIIMGANVGTTFSAQLIAFGMGAFNLSTIATTFIFAGAVIHIFLRNQRIRDIGFVILAFGIMFFGVTYMSDAMRPLRDHVGFQEFLVGFENPVLALLAGFIVTAIIQSSTATTAILVTILASGVVMPFQTAAFILLGVNIGTSLTTMLASIPANRDSKRAALFHIMYDILGSAVFGTLILVFPGILNWFTTTWEGNPAQQAAMFHTLYNVSTVVLLLPFVTYIAKLMHRIVPVVSENLGATYEKKLLYLDDPLPRIPTTATFNAKMEISRMGEAAATNFSLAVTSLLGREKSKPEQIPENEEVIDFLNHKITSKLTIINRMSLSPLDAVKVGKMFLVLSDIERIGDHAVSIATHTDKMLSSGRSFSPPALEELAALASSVEKLVFTATSSFAPSVEINSEDFRAAAKKAAKQARRSLKNHTKRLKEEICDPATGIIFTAIINDLQRTLAHAKNIAFSANIEDKWNEA